MAIERLDDLLLHERNLGLTGARSLTGGDPSGLLARLLSGEINLNNVNRRAAENALAYVLNMQQPPGQGNEAGILSALSRQRDDQLGQLLSENESRLARYGYNPDALQSRLGTTRSMQPRLPIAVMPQGGAGPSEIMWGDAQADEFRSQMSSLDDVLLQESDAYLQQLNNQKARLLARNNPPATAILAAAGSAPEIGSMVPSALRLAPGAADDLTIAASLGPEAIQDATQSVLGQSADSRVQALRQIPPNELRTLMDTLRRDPSRESQELYRTLQQLQFRTDASGMRVPVGVGSPQMSTFPNVGLTSPIVGSPPNTPQLVQQARQAAGIAGVGQENRTRVFTGYGPGFTPAVQASGSPEQLQRVLAAMESGLLQQPPELSDQQRFPASMQGPGNRQTMSTDQLADMLMSSDPETRARAEALVQQRSEAGSRRFAAIPDLPAAGSEMPPAIAGAVGRVGSRPSQIQQDLTRQAQAYMDRFQGSAVSPPSRGLSVPSPESIDFRNPGEVDQWVDLKLKELIGPGLDAIPAERRNTAEFKQLAQLLNDPNSTLIENGRLNPSHVRLMEQVLPEHLNRPIIQKNFVSLLTNLELMQGDTSGLEGRTIPNREAEYQERRQYERRADNPQSEKRARMKASLETRTMHGRVMSDMGIVPMADSPTTNSDVSYKKAVRLRRKGLSAGRQGAFAGREAEFANDPNAGEFGFGSETSKSVSRMSPEDARLLQADGGTPVTAPQGKLNRLKFGANLLLFGNSEAAGYSRWSPEAIATVMAGRDIGPKSFSPDVNETIERAYTYDQLVEQGMSDEDINRLPQRPDRKTGVTKYIKSETTQQVGQQIGSPTRNLASTSVDSMLGLESSNYTNKRLAPGRGGVRHRRAGERYERRLAEIDDVNKAITRLGQTANGRQALKRLEAAIQSGDADTVRAIVSQAGGLNVQAPSRGAIRQGSVEVRVRPRAGQPAQKRRVNVVSNGTSAMTPGAYLESKSTREAASNPEAIGAIRSKNRKDFRFRGTPQATNTGEAVANSTRAAAAERRSAEGRGDRVRPDRRRTTERERGRLDDDIMRFDQRVRDHKEINEREGLKQATSIARARGKKAAAEAGVPEAEVYLFKREEVEGMRPEIRRRLEGVMRKRRAEVLIREENGKMTQMFKSGDVRMSGGELTARGKASSSSEFRSQDLKALLDRHFKSRNRKARRETGSQKSQQIASQINRMGLDPTRAAEYVESSYTHLTEPERIRLARAIREMANRTTKAKVSPALNIGRAIMKIATRGKG